MDNNNTSFSNSTAEPKGCRTAVIVILVIIFLIIGTPFFLIWMTQPSQKQWTELTAITSGQAESGISTTSTGVLLKEDWLDYQIDRALTMIFQEADIEAEYAGSNLVLEKDSVSFQMGATFENPAKGKLGPDELKAMIKAEFKIIIDRDSMLSAELKKIKIGKLSIPVSFLVKNLMKIQSVQSALSPEKLSLQGIKNLNLKDQVAQVDLNELSNEVVSGLTIQYARILPGRISISIILPAELQKEIHSIANLLYETSPSIREDLEEKIPLESIREIEEGEKLLAVLAEEKGDSRHSFLTSYLDGFVSSQKTGDPVQNDLDFGVRISEKSTLLTGKDSYGEFILPGESLLKLMEDSVVHLKSGINEGSQNMTALEMASGKIRAVVSKQKKEDLFTIQAGNTVMEIRGTDFIIEYKKGKVELTVLEGNVRVNDSIIVGESQSLRISGQKVSAVKNVDPEDLDEFINKIPMYTSKETAEALSQYNSLPSLVDLYSVYSEMWEKLSSENRDQVMHSIEENLNKNPEFAEKIEAFMEKAGMNESTD